MDRQRTNLERHWIKLWMDQHSLGALRLIKMMELVT